MRENQNDAWTFSVVAYLSSSSWPRLRSIYTVVLLLLPEKGEWSGGSVGKFFFFLPGLTIFLYVFKHFQLFILVQIVFFVQLVFSVKSVSFEFVLFDTVLVYIYCYVNVKLKLTGFLAEYCCRLSVCCLLVFIVRCICRTQLLFSGVNCRMFIVDCRCRLQLWVSGCCVSIVGCRTLVVDCQGRRSLTFFIVGAQICCR